MTYLEDRINEQIELADQETSHQVVLGLIEQTRSTFPNTDNLTAPLVVDTLLQLKKRYPDQVVNPETLADYFQQLKSLAAQHPNEFNKIFRATAEELDLPWDRIVNSLKP